MYVLCECAVRIHPEENTFANFSKVPNLILKPQKHLEHLPSAAAESKYPNSKILKEEYIEAGIN